MRCTALSVGILCLGGVACSEPQLTTPVSNLLVHEDGWLRFDGADIRRPSSSAIEFWEAGRLSSTIDFSPVAGDCAVSPPSVLIGAGAMASVRIECGVGGGTIQAVSTGRIAQITVEAHDGGTAQMDGGADGGGAEDDGGCSFVRLLFGDTFSFQQTEPGQSRVEYFTMLLEAGDSCSASISLNDVSFRLLSTPTFDADAGRSVALGPGGLFRFGVEFSPVDFGRQYDASVALPQGVRLLLSGGSSPFCPRFDAGCPLPVHAVYVSTSDSLFVLDGGAEKIGDFIRIDGITDGIKDIAILDDGTFWALGSALYLVDPSSGAMRSVQGLGPGFSALESGIEPGQVLIGGINGVFSLGSNGQLTPIGLPMQVSGDIARLDSDIALVTVRETPTNDALFSLNLRSQVWTRLCSLGVADVWGLTNSAQGPVGVTSGGSLLRIEPVTCSVNSSPLQGVWTGAAWW